MQLVLSNNRVIAHGENFLSFGGVVINTKTGVKYENATIAECDSCPSDIDKVGYEYHAGVFVPCAPFGKSNQGKLMIACKECATPRTWEDIDRVLLHDYQPISGLPVGAVGATNIIYCDNKFYAANGNELYVSADGYEWEYVTTLSFYINNMIGHKGRLVATSSSGDIYTSSDGVNWRLSFEESGTAYYYIASGNGVIVVMGDASKYVVSSDGETWTQNQVYSNCHNNPTITFNSAHNLFECVIGNSPSNEYIYCSSDGINWSTELNLTSINGYWEVAGCDLGVLAYYQNNIKFRLKGQSWSDETLPFNLQQIHSITSGNGKAVITANINNVLYSVLYSADLVTWTTAIMPYKAEWKSVVYANGMFIAVASDSSKCAISTDGVTWTAGTLEITNSEGVDIMKALLYEFTTLYGVAYQEGVNRA
jgi:hypothetical protein